MTVQGELNTYAHEMEWVLCIEGIGWPADDADLSDGINGRIFVTKDIDGTMAADLVATSLTVAAGLYPPGSISDSLDPETIEYQAGGLGLDVLDVGDWLLSNVCPMAADNSATLETAIEHSTTTVRLTESDHSYAAGDVIWMGGREAIKLGTRSVIGGGVFSYASCVRGYLGTPAGRFDRHQITQAFGWAVGTAVYSLNPFWLDRRVTLFLHVPGDPPENLLRIYHGRITGIRHKDLSATVWQFSTMAETTNGLARTYSGGRGWTVKENYILSAYYQWWTPDDFHALGGGQDPRYDHTIVDATDQSARRELRFRFSEDDGSDLDTFDKYALGFAYCYRTEPGGTAGVIAAIDGDPTAPQARSDFTVDGSTGRLGVGAMASIGGEFAWLMYKEFDRYQEAEPPYTTIIARGVVPAHGINKTDLYAANATARFMLDNMAGGYKMNRFTVNNVATRNVVDVFLCLTTTMPGEFFIGDASGGTTTVVDFTGPAWTTDQWVGYALHAVDGPNKGEARVITGNDSNSITVGTAFSNDTYTGTPYEHQIRNSIYDVLPVPFGLRVHNNRIDISGIEAIRDAYLRDAVVGGFAIGGGDDFDLWELLKRNILQPYGLLDYIDRATGKLSLRYIAGAPTDALVETYATVAAQNIIELGGQDVIPRAPVVQYEVKIRGEKEAIISPIRSNPNEYGMPGKIIGYRTSMTSELSPLTTGEQRTWAVRVPMLDAVFDASLLGTRSIDAMFNDLATLPQLAAILGDRLFRTFRPPPEVEIALDVSYIPRVQAGSILAVTDTTVNNPVNPHSAGNRGWSGKLLRVLSTSIETSASKPAMRCRAQILEAETSALVAPAATVTAKNEPGGGADDNFTVNPNDWTFDDGNDTDGLAVGDLIEVRSSTGAYKAGPFTISAVTATQVDVDEDISAYTFAADDYLTFSLWVSATVTSNMRKFAFHGDTDGSLGSGDDAETYG